MRRQDQSGSRDHIRAHRQTSGFTLVELMVVVAIIGILSTIAVLSVRSQTYAGTVRGYSETIVAEIEGARARAVATGRWQQLEITPTAVLHWEANTEGMGAPVGYDLVRTLATPKGVFVRAMDDRTHLAPDDGVPAVGAGLDGAVNFAPDGSAESATIFIGDDNDKDHQRVAIFRATGTAYVYKDW